MRVESPVMGNHTPRFGGGRRDDPTADQATRHHPAYPTMWTRALTERRSPTPRRHWPKALVRQGLVAEAMRGGGDGLPLLRGITAQTIAGVAGEEQVIVFAERVWCLRQLTRTLSDRHDVETHVADGQVKPHEFEELKRRFTAGEFPVLCLSRIGHEGHNLQNASCIVNLDLPWLPSGLEQRI